MIEQEQATYNICLVYFPTGSIPWWYDGKTGYMVVREGYSIAIKRTVGEEITWNLQSERFDTEEEAQQQFDLELSK